MRATPTPLRATPLRATPLRATLLRATPLRATPTPFRATPPPRATRLHERALALTLALALARRGRVERQRVELGGRGDARAAGDFASVTSRVASLSGSLVGGSRRRAECSAGARGGEIKGGLSATVSSVARERRARRARAAVSQRQDRGGSRAARSTGRARRRIRPLVTRDRAAARSRAPPAPPTSTDAHGGAIHRATVPASGSSPPDVRGTQSTVTSAIAPAWRESDQGPVSLGSFLLVTGAPARDGRDGVTPLDGNQRASLAGRDGRDDITQLDTGVCSKSGGARALAGRTSNA